MTGCKPYKSRYLFENKCYFASLSAFKQEMDCESFDTFIHSQLVAPAFASLFLVNSQLVEEDQFTFVDKDQSLSSRYFDDDTDLLLA